MLDFHNHLIPGVDDGAASLVESRAALAEMQAQGFSGIITTPHIHASTLPHGGAAGYMERVDQAWGELQSLAAKEFPTLVLRRGFEVLLDVPRVDLSDARLRLAGTRFVLVEFPWSGIPIRSTDALFAIKANGYVPIVAHPERYADMDRELKLAERWLRSGAYLQVNEGSLVGQYNSRSRALAWRALERGLASYLSSDYHARGTCAANQARDALMRRPGGVDVFKLLTGINPGLMLEGKDPLPVPALTTQQKSWWRRVMRRG
jgi:protein-tyrosine phosphatase